MFFCKKPDSKKIQQFKNEQAKLDFTYENVGSTSATPPAGYVVDHTRQKLGQGEAVFEITKQAMQQWQPFQLGWVAPYSIETPITKGEVVVVVARVLGLWWLNACRIVYTIDEQNPNKFGFAYGTLPGHAESGEERFMIEIGDAGNVWYDILAFSQPNHWLTRLGYPLARRMQKRFARGSVAAMQQAVSSSNPAISQTVPDAESRLDSPSS